MSRLARAAGCLVTAALAAACSSGSSSGATSAGTTVAGSGGSGVKDPCALVTAADVGAAMGGTVDPSTSTFTGTYQACTYTTADGPLLVTSRLIDQGAFDRSIKERTGEDTPLPSLCTEAFLSGPIVLGWKNGTEADVRVLTVTSNAVTAAKALAVKACSRL